MLNRSAINLKGNLSLVMSSTSLLTDQSRIDRVEEEQAITRKLAQEKEERIQEKADLMLDQLVQDETIC